MSGEVEGVASSAQFENQVDELFDHADDLMINHKRFDQAVSVKIDLC